MDGPIAYFNIKTPIWSSHSVGLAADRIMALNVVNITYKNKQGFRMYPNLFEISANDVKRCPVQILYRHGRKVTLYLVPIDAMKVKAKL